MLLEEVHNPGREKTSCVDMGTRAPVWWDHHGAVVSWKFKSNKGF